MEKNVTWRGTASSLEPAFQTPSFFRLGRNVQKFFQSGRRTQNISYIASVEGNHGVAVLDEPFVDVYTVKEERG